MIRMPNFIVIAYLEVPKVAKPGPTDRQTDRQNLQSLYVTWLIPSAIKTATEKINVSKSATTRLINNHEIKDRKCKILRIEIIEKFSKKKLSRKN